MNKVLTSERFWAAARMVAALLILSLFVIQGWFLFKFMGLPGLGLRYLLTPILFFFLIIWAAARYVRFAYQLPGTYTAVRYLFVSIFGPLPWSLFGLGYPVLLIENGEKILDTDQASLLELIGGPAYVLIQQDNAVLCESPTGTTVVLEPGFQYLSRFSRIKEIISLKEQAWGPQDTSTYTKDGIKVTVKGIRFRFRLRRNSASSESSGWIQDHPYPFSKEAARLMFYNRTLNDLDGNSHTWDFGLKFTIEGAITDHINRHLVDQLIGHSDHNPDPREAINARLNSEKTRVRMDERGAELLWFDIGHFEPPKEVSKQRLSPWQAKWSGRTEIERSSGKWQRIALQERGRAEAQAELLMNIVHTLDDLGIEGDSRQNLRNVILVRTAQILEAMTEGQPFEAGDKPV